MALDTFNPYLFVSAGEQSNKFLTPTYADDIAQFQAQRAQELTGLTVRIEGVQEGTGDPAPDNICPISGRTGLTVTASGSNLLNIQPQSGTVSGVSYVVDSEGYITLNGTATASLNLYLATHIAPFNSQVTLSSDKAIPTNVYTGLVQQNGSSGILELRPGETIKTSGESGIAEETRYRMYIVSGATFNNFKYRPMLNFGATALPNAPYNGATYPITWQTEAGTVYGGTLDVVSGVLTVDRGYYEFTGDESSWNKSSTYQGSFYTSVTLISPLMKTYQQGGDLICSHAKYIGTPTASTYVYGCCGLDSSINLFLGTAEMTPAEFRQWLSDQKTAGTPVTISGKLATPQTYQLTPEDVKTLAGFNQIYSDAGPVIDIKF